jgi:glycine/D-amino acid oxidase-like deaminating enzyme
MINVYAEMTPGTFEDSDLAARFALVEPAMSLWDEHTAKLRDLSGLPIDVTWGTYLILNARSTAIEMESFDYIRQSVIDRNIEHRDISPLDIPYLRPMEGHAAIRALWLPDGRMDARQLIAASEAAVRALDIKTFDAEATGISLRERRGFVTRAAGTKSVTLSDDSVLTGPNVVFANGAFAQSLIDLDKELKAETPRLLYGGGCALDLIIPPWVKEFGGIGRTLLDMNAVVRTTDRGGACGVHVVPLGNAEFYCGASSAVWVEPDYDPKAHGVHILLHSVITEFSREFFYANVKLRGNGFRPTTVDYYPLLGESHLSGVWFMNGMKRDGLTASLYLSEELSKAIRGLEHALPERFRPSRKLISYKRKEQAIAATERMYAGSDIQHGGIQAPYNIDRFKQARFAPIEALYENRKIQNFGIHPELVHLYENEQYYQMIKHDLEID